MEDQEFKELIRRSKRVEYEIMKYYRQKVDPKARMALIKTKEYDIICPKVGNVEVKEDRLAVKTGFYALETEDQEGKASGVSITTAGDFVIVDESNVLLMKTTSLFYIIDQCKTKKLLQMGYTTKEGKRAWGYLIPIKEFVFSPYVEVVARWFP